MEKNKINSGDLVYVPSEVYLYKEEEAVTDWTKLKEPINLLVTSVNPATYEVFYSDDYWLVAKHEVHPI